MTQKYSKTHLRSPFWLKGSEVEVLDKQLTAKICTLDGKQQKKVTALLYSIAYAEKWALRRRKWLTRWLTYWVVPRATLAGRNVRKVTSDMGDLPGLVDVLVRQVGLEKSAPAILAEYHDVTFKHQKRGFFPWLQKLFRPPRPSAYIEDGMEAYHYILKD